MASPILLTEALTVPATNVTPDVTVLSGGQSYINGYNGGDFALCTNAPVNVRKKLGNSQINPTPWTDAGALPYFQDSIAFRAFAFDGRDALGHTGLNDTPEPGSINNAGAWVLGDGDAGLNKGIDYIFDADQNLRRFVFMGGLACGNYTITASFADSSMPASVITLNGPNIYNSDERWFAVSFRSINPTTVRIRIRRTTQLSGATGYIVTPACYLTANVPAPAPRAYKSFLASRGAFGGFN